MAADPGPQPAPAPAVAPHQQQAYGTEVLVARVVGILGLLVTIGGAVQGVLQPGSHAVLVVGAVITVASQLQHSLAHYAYQANA